MMITRGSNQEFNSISALICAKVSGQTARILENVGTGTPVKECTRKYMTTAQDQIYMLLVSIGHEPSKDLNGERLRYAPAPARPSTTSDFFESVVYNVANKLDIPPEQVHERLLAMYKTCETVKRGEQTPDALPTAKFFKTVDETISLYVR